MLDSETVRIIKSLDICIDLMKPYMSLNDIAIWLSDSRDLEGYISPLQKIINGEEDFLIKILKQRYPNVGL